MSRFPYSFPCCEGGHRHPKTQLQSVTYSRRPPSAVVWIGIFLLAGTSPSPYLSPLSAHSNATKSKRPRLSPCTPRSFQSINQFFVGNLWPSSCPIPISANLSQSLMPIPISLMFIPQIVQAPSRGLFNTRLDTVILPNLHPPIGYLMPLLCVPLPPLLRPSFNPLSTEVGSGT